MESQAELRQSIAVRPCAPKDEFMQDNRQKEEQERLARRYAWWKEPDEAMHDLPHLLCQIMAFGTAEDYVVARQIWGEAAIKKALQNARPGAMDDRSWAFWHRYYNLPLRTLPKRRFDEAAS